MLVCKKSTVKPPLYTTEIKIGSFFQIDRNFFFHHDHRLHLYSVRINIILKIVISELIHQSIKTIFFFFSKFLSRHLTFVFVSLKPGLNFGSYWYWLPGQLQAKLKMQIQDVDLSCVSVFPHTAT